LTTIQCMGVLAHPLRPQSFPVAERIASSLQARQIQTFVFTEWQEDNVIPAVQDCNMVVAIGGDGAMLRAARVCAPYNIPVLGVNMGQLGFLTEISDPADWETYLDRILNQDFWIEKRMMLTVDVTRDEEELVTDHALNDVVISGDVTGRMIQLEAYIDGDWATTYYADALIISTPTGSTAYALACGGPILPPELKNILIVPSAPHLSMDRPMVLSEGAEVEIRSYSVNRNESMLITDGIVICRLKPQDRVRIRASAYSSHFVRMRGRNYFYRSLFDRLEPRVRRPQRTDGL
jgi:NAD+ kinase